MSKVYGIFTEGNGEFSWRKAMTAGCLLIFMTAQLGYLIVNSFGELPTAYWAVDAGVFTFYFAKNMLDKLTITSK